MSWYVASASTPCRFWSAQDHCAYEETNLRGQSVLRDGIGSIAGAVGVDGVMTGRAVHMALVVLCKVLEHMDEESTRTTRTFAA